MKPQDELLKRYHEANGHDPARPGAALRENVLAQARASAGKHTAPGAGRPEAANETAWRWRALGGLAVLGLATLVVLQFDRGTPDERELALGHPPASPTAPQATPPATASPAPAPATADPSTAARKAAPSAKAQPAPAPPVATPRARALERDEAPSSLSSRRATPAPAASPEAALLAAATRGAVDGARDALARGADVNGSDAEGRTALMRAAQRGDAALVRLLLDAGADAQRSDRDGLRAVDLAREAGHLALLPLLENNAPR